MHREEAVTVVRELVDNTGVMRTGLTRKQLKALSILLGDEPAKPKDDPTRVHVKAVDLQTGVESRMSVSVAAQLLQLSVEVVTPGKSQPIEFYQDRLFSGDVISTPYRLFQRLP
jgi:hypothetical protein